MSEQCAPIVYLGPTLSAAAAKDVLPDCVLRPPIRRGDLYRERQGGGTLFIMIDGVLFQEPAVPPREILDVLDDGAMVVGASSMGALRAAECWPRGMRGVGTIYRLFRSGRLHSDDEVILIYSQDADYRNLSVPLINVRYALSRAVRCGRLERSVAAAILAQARATHYSDRTWTQLLAGLEASDNCASLAGWLSRQDLKRKDALRCLRRVRKWLQEDPDLSVRPRLRSADFVPSEAHREREHDALAGLGKNEVKRELSRWQLLSGRYTKHALAIACASGRGDVGERLQQKLTLEPLLTLLSREDESDACGNAAQRDAHTRAVALRCVLLELWQILARDTSAFAEALWAELATEGELDAEIFRWRALRAAAGEARRLGLRARARDEFEAESEIAHAHGFAAWRDLQRASALAPVPWQDFVDYRDELALAKRLREELFNSHTNTDTLVDLASPAL